MSDDRGTPAPPEEAVGYLLVRLAHTLSRRWSHDLGQHGVSARQHGVLATLAARPGVSAGALARTVMITPQAMGELLAGLEERDLVRRRPPVGRGHPASLEVTPAGRRVLQEVEGVVAASNSPATLGLTDGETAQLRRLLTKVLDATT